MQFDVQERNGTLIFSLYDRRLDSTISSELKGEFLIICTSAIDRLIIDLSAVEFCDSSGLSALLFAERQMRENDGVVQLVGLNDPVASLFKISQLDRVFAVYESLEEALSEDANGKE